MKSILYFTVLSAFFSLPIRSQEIQTLTIENCYALASEHYPLAKQRELILKSRDYSIENISKGYLPQVNIVGQASYQSEVTQVPIQLPNTAIPVLDKDQYKIYGEINQVVYDGGMIKQQKLSQESKSLVEAQKLEVELYKLKERINDLYFGILLVNEQLRQNALKKDDIALGIKKTEAQLANGTVFRSSLDILKAEYLTVSQQTLTLLSNKKAYLNMLALFLNKPLDDNTLLVTPVPPVLSTQNNRPELGLFEQQAKNIDIQQQAITIKNIPKLNLFFQGGMGKPALNMLSNDFEAYYIGGIRLNWSLFGYYTQRKEKDLLNINKEDISIQKETFLFNTNYQLQQQNEEISRLSGYLISDQEIISLRGSIKKAALAQLENGVSTTSDYLREVNAEDTARQNKILHQIQLLAAQYKVRLTQGN
ncbi:MULTISPECIES: TolC family protein [unclassified Flavobacterium]|uniref:TolC family protein n=1 Tax=unclassified Flavobacterium TaxID=196869 RepID=UPI000869A8B7|nr:MULTISPECIES: TolC family protein [unclassified Flavobacterium]MBN9286060.1 TolC family protein [Flavobacterium sp.]ODS90259.1 MAG: transporter [Chryseobacterium sp. SCN 40-13]OJV68408.1 MAG: transporter [Flavobacterium sp. 40-81]